MSRIPTTEELMALPPEYLAADTHQILFNVTTAFAVVTTLVYVPFLVSRTTYAERNSWDIWVLPLLSYLSNIGLYIVSHGRFSYA
jgi:uncharacterized membrane protein